MKLLAKFLLAVFSLLLVAHYVPGIELEGLYVAIVVAFILGIFNIIVKPILIILTLPINLLTLGLFTFVINAAIFWFVASIIEGFTVEGFIPALVGTIIISVVSWIGNKFL